MDTMNDNNKASSLFVGNLSMFINEDDIEALFGQYATENKNADEKIIAKIIRTEVGVSRGYGFIKMLNEADAETAMINLHGKQFHGRPLKVKWSERNAKKDDATLLSVNDREISVHVKFSAKNGGYLITEETILHHFSKCGKVVDVSIKQSSFDNLNGLHRGYAFVHFEVNAIGKDSAIRAANQVSGDSLVQFECQLSRNLLKQLQKSDEKDEKAHSENIADRTTSAVTTMTSSIPHHKISNSMTHPPFAAPSSSSVRQNSQYLQLSQGQYDGSPDDKSQPPLQSVYPNPHPSHATPYISGPNISSVSPRYMLPVNQFVNDNTQQQYLRQQHEQQQHYQMTLQGGYPPRYHLANQTGIPTHRRSGPIPLPMPMSLSPAMPMPMSPAMPMSQAMHVMPMYRYPIEYPYPHSQLQQQAPYISYTPHSVVRLPTGAAYNPNHQYEQLQQYRMLKPPQQHVYSNSLPSTYIPQLPSPSHTQHSHSNPMPHPMRQFHRN